jgi:hypothetical protein
LAEGSRSSDLNPRRHFQRSTRPLCCGKLSKICRYHRQLTFSWRRGFDKSKNVTNWIFFARGGMHTHRLPFITLECFNRVSLPKN